MLVITRRKNEGFYVGNSYIRILAEKEGEFRRPGEVRIGIQAPPNIKILREELATTSDKELTNG